jgi:hypothetical protein
MNLIIVIFKIDVNIYDIQSNRWYAITVNETSLFPAPRFEAACSVQTNVLGHVIL